MTREYQYKTGLCCSNPPHSECFVKLQKFGSRWYFLFADIWRLLHFNQSLSPPSNLFKDLVEILERLVPELCSSDCLDHLKVSQIFTFPNIHRSNYLLPQIEIVPNILEPYLVHGGHVGAPLMTALHPNAGCSPLSPRVQAAHTAKHLFVNPHQKVKPIMGPKYG